ncbi:hypothetical protein ACFPM3_13740 [Streptomyces coeruleoprunus]|uniref:DUF4232 domain-containing protein n=1 Tax=Streptomyces coeruleoprunus TaxID=285563 RepID=A0ABV9XFY3_9ACTN
MGSLRNPVGPLPSSIYWRRRAVAASLAALLAVLIVWFVSSGDDEPAKAGDDAKATSPAPSITPGPTPSGPAISSQPGGRDESDDPGDQAGTSAGAGTDGKNGDTSSAGGDGSGGGSGDGSSTGAGGGTGSAQQVPATSPLPTCAPGSLQLALSTTKVSYAPGEKPRFRLTARNTSSAACKTDLGPATAVLTVSDETDDQVWSSKDCPSGSGSAWVAVPAGGTATYTVEWDRRHSAPQCATPAARTAAPGTYLAEATVPGAKVLRAAITLTKD